MEWKWIGSCMLLFISLISGHYHHRHHQQSYRILNGNEAFSNNKFPWMAIMLSRAYNFNTYQYDSNFLISCSGSIISEKFILTSAQCVFDSSYNACSTCPVRTQLKNTSTLRVVVGNWNLADSNRDTDWLEVQDIWYNMYYDNCKRENDIAILELKKYLNLNDRNSVKSIGISGQWIQPGQMATVAGWGSRCNNGPPNEMERLSSLSVTVEENRDCHLILTAYKPDDTYLCAGSDFGKVVPMADIGGGLWFEENDIVKLIGVVSLAMEGCGINNAIYTRLSHYIPWIYEIFEMA